MSMSIAQPLKSWIESPLAIVLNCTEALRWSSTTASADSKYGVRSGKFKTMTIYAVAIKGRGVAAFDAEDGAAAAFRVRDRLFRDDLMVLATDGIPLWDGVTDLVVRQALPLEEAKWRASRAKAIRQGSIEEEDEGWIAFLVALTDVRRAKR
jgi:hypothetical protein